MLWLQWNPFSLAALIHMTITPEFLIQCALKGNSALAYGVPSLSLHIASRKAMAELGVKNTLALGGPTWFAAALLSFFGLKQLFAVQRTNILL